MSFDWRAWFNILCATMERDKDTDFSTTLFPIFMSAPPPDPSDLPPTERMLRWALDMDDRSMAAFLITHTPRDPKIWRNICKWWPSDDCMHALIALEMDSHRQIPLQDFVCDVPKQVTDAFEQYNLTREAIFVLMEIEKLNKLDGDKAIRHRIACMLITAPVRIEEWGPRTVSIEGVQYDLTP